MIDSSPFISFCGVQVFIDRDGINVSGQVRLPYTVAGRAEIPINYQSRRTGINRQSSIVNLHPRVQRRLDLVYRWREHIRACPNVSKIALASEVIVHAREEGTQCSLRSLQLWAQKLDRFGPEGLNDHYVAPPKKILQLTPDQERAALGVCAWWCLRIGNLDTINYKTMHAAAQKCTAGFQPADIIATIDYYYAYPTDRIQYPFKLFSKWLRYDFERWLIQAANDADYRRALAERRNVESRRAGIANIDYHDVPLRTPPAVAPTTRPPSSKQRRCETRYTEPAIARQAGKMARTVSVRDQLPPSLPRCLDASLPCLRQAARDVLTAATPGTLKSKQTPSTIAEALARLDPPWQQMLLGAAQGDRQARKQALLTLAAWWPKMPRELAAEIEAAAEAELGTPSEGRTPPARRQQLFAAACLARFLPRILAPDSGLSDLSPAARLPICRLDRT
ncbi:hypothetical protein AMJ85_09900 [candidate division BRC1 bacterium SM23_51]|nr:MAG: hypothetical protein AMJ85_09900 [candidate division BRC1 bacterium SM23_51]